MELTKEALITMYKKIVEVRRFEEKVVELYKAGHIPGVAHPYIGEEAIAVGVCSALGNDDYILSSHRGHGHSIAKGVPSKFVLAELFGKETGVCKGIGGSMHSTYLERGVLFSTAIVGGNIPMGVGVGLAITMKKQDKVVVCFFGDGASNTGAFHEGINLAALWKLPVIFVCENNLYAISTHASRSVSAKNIADRAIAYNIPGEIVDGNNVLAVHESATNAIKRARNGGGPTLLECRTYRCTGHGVYEMGSAYRSQEEVNEWRKKCPIPFLKDHLLQKGYTTEAQLDKIEREIEIVINEAVEFAKNSDYPTWEMMTQLLYV